MNETVISHYAAKPFKNTENKHPGAFFKSNEATYLKCRRIPYQNNPTSDVEMVPSFRVIDVWTFSTTDHISVLLVLVCVYVKYRFLSEVAIIFYCQWILIMCIDIFVIQLRKWIFEIVLIYLFSNTKSTMPSSRFCLTFWICLPELRD